MFELEMFPARDGDCLVVTWGETGAPKRMLIDGGRESAWAELKKAYKDLPEPERTFELLVVTHIDADHIAGVLKMLADPNRPLKFKEVWFNAYHHLVEGDWETFGPGQGETLSDLLKARNDVWNRRFDGKAVVISDDTLPQRTIEGLEITLVSPTREKLQALVPEWKAWLRSEGLDRDHQPTGEPPAAAMIPEGYEAFGARPNVATLAAVAEREDTTPPNGTSIAFIAAFGDKRVLLAADAHPGVLERSIRSLPDAERRFDLVKISHHGSKANLTRSFLRAFKCDRFAISTDGSRHEHPDPETIARLLTTVTDRKHLLFNYRHEQAAVWDDDDLKKDFDYDCVFPSDNAMGRLKISI
ncbi:MBL fold metallo-hydrolase (plasmid) [Rhizobium laguerreae]|uniref:MBL fold metallo-hydrolase n=1 Tax=Rhizobium TaxID=379 RepID=UPI001A90E579|nr:MULTISPECIES: MBL fold metallo-hydrolase [Rhizobium]MBY5558112.1 MBL fold metallo-hydrolase [Rhizobium leguminosarum]QSW27873.1 MBL fold metallo-hydrolase [Rhizobium leguminosarum]UFW67791.1 MBL fold metallo-hydrolase [Rhizobium laguerreae]